MHHLKLIKIESGTGLLLSEDMLQRLNIKAGDFLEITETPAGYLLAAAKSTTTQQLQAGREFMNSFEDAFCQLAKE